MFIIRAEHVPTPVTITSIFKRTVNLGLDTDNLIACFTTRAEAESAMNGTDTGEYWYNQSLALASRDLYVVEVKEEREGTCPKPPTG